MRQGVGTPGGRRRQSGAALIFAVLIVGLLLASSTASLESSLLTMRAERYAIDRMVDFHLADTLLTVCERRLAGMAEPGATARSVRGTGSDTPSASARAAAGPPAPSPGTAPAAASSVAASSVAALRRAMAGRPEPTQWRHPRAFDTDGPRRWRIVLPVPSAGAPRGGPPAVSSFAPPVVSAASRRGGTRVCLVETWVDAPGVGRVLLLTVHVPALRPDAGHGTWLQSILAITATGGERHWRAVAEPPAPSPS